MQDDTKEVLRSRVADVQRGYKHHGIVMLAAEFTWARRVLDVGIDRGVDAKRRVQAAGAVARLLSTLAVLCLAGAVIAFFVLR